MKDITLYKKPSIYYYRRKDPYQFGSLDRYHNPKINASYIFTDFLSYFDGYWILSTRITLYIIVEKSCYVINPKQYSIKCRLKKLTKSNIDEMIIEKIGL